MQISSNNNVNFKGHISLYTDIKGIELTNPKTFDTKDIKEIKSTYKGTQIAVQKLQGKRCVPTFTDDGKAILPNYVTEKIVVPYDIKEVLDAYNAAKDSDLHVDYTLGKSRLFK